MLVERGCDPVTAVRRVRAVRPHAIETAAQERYVMNSKSRMLTEGGERC
jgi:hypothetical protein